MFLFVCLTNKKMFPLVKGFLADTYVKAFVLGAIIQALVATAAVEIRQQLDMKDNTVNWSEGWKVTATLLISFAIALICYFFMYYMFGFGGGMITYEVPVG